MSNKFKTAIILIKEAGFLKFCKKAFFFLFYRIYFYFGIIFPFNRNKFAFKLLTRLHNDLQSLEMLNCLLPLLNNKQNPELNLLVPDYLYYSFARYRKLFNKGKINLKSYSECVQSDIFSIILIHNFMFRTILEYFSLHFNEYSTVFKNEVFSIIVNNNLDYLNNKYNEKVHRNLEQSIKNEIEFENKLSKDKNIITGPHNFRFLIRPYTMDSDIINEIDVSYIKYLENKALNGGNIIDLGAHIGSFSIQITRLIGVNGKVFSYEPEPDNFRNFKKNIELNKLNNIMANQMAVSNKKGKAVLHISPDNTGGHKLNVGDPSSKYSVEVEMTTIEEIFSKIDGKINVLKVDVEGSEHSIIIPFMKLIKKRVKYIVAEAGSSMHGDGNTILNILNDNGFKTEYSGNKGLMIIHAENSNF